MHEIHQCSILLLQRANLLNGRRHCYNLRFDILESIKTLLIHAIKIRSQTID